MLQKALKHWLVLISSWNSGIEFVVCLQGCDSTNAQLIMLGDVFRGKAPSTLTKHAKQHEDTLSDACRCWTGFSPVMNLHCTMRFVSFGVKGLRLPEVKEFWKPLHLHVIQWAF